jgi:hypothetical protein
MKGYRKSILTIYTTLLIFFSISLPTQAQSYYAKLCLNSNDCFCNGTNDILITGGIGCPLVNCTVNGTTVSTSIVTTVRISAPIGPNNNDAGVPWHWHGDCHGRFYGFQSVENCATADGVPVSATEGGSVNPAPGGISIICTNLPTSNYLPLITK